MNFITSHKGTLGIVGLALFAFIGTFAFAIETETTTDTSTSTTETLVETISEVPATSTPEGDLAVPSATTTEVAVEPAATATQSTTTENVTTTDAIASVVPAADTPNAPATQTAQGGVEVDCTWSYVSDLYDTPSGHLEPGYYLNAVPATTTGKVAQKIGTQAWTVCNDEAGAPHEFTLTEQEYSDLAKPDATIPKKSILVPVSGQQ